MGVFAAMTLIIGILPDLFLAPISDYIGGMFEGQDGVLPVPVHAESGNNGAGIFEPDPSGDELGSTFVDEGEGGQ
jgi:hypothetical protein